MIKKSVQDAINAQINEELYSAYLYAAMRAYFEELNLKGFSNWMRIQVEEELFHAKKFANFLFDRSGKVAFKAIKEPKVEWKSVLEAFQAAYKHECHISECINKLATLAEKESDHATRAFLEWYITEQVEEEANADAMVNNLKLVEGAPSGLFMLDREAGQRVVSPLIVASITGVPAAQ